MEPIEAVLDGTPIELRVAAREPDRIAMTVDGRDVELSRAELRRLMWQLAHGHTVALEMESALIGVHHG